MHRPIRLALASLVLVALAAGTALAVQQPAAERSDALTQEADAPLTAEAAQALVDRLATAGLETDVATLTALAADHGVGGAVRLLGWSQETGESVDAIATMRADGMGWGQIAKELDTHPGIGTWMRGGNGPPEAGSEAGSEAGRGRDTAPGQVKKHRP